MKTLELTGPALNYAVAVALGAAQPWTIEVPA